MKKRALILSSVAVAAVAVAPVLAKQIETSIVEITHKSVAGSISQDFSSPREGAGSVATTNFDIFAKVKETYAYDSGESGAADDTQDVSTTFYGGGYFSFLKVGSDSEKALSFECVDSGDPDGKTCAEKNSVDGVLAEITAQDYNGDDEKKVVVTYKLKNTTGEGKDYSLASATDIEVGNNDNAALLKRVGHSGFKVTQDNSHYFGFKTSFDIILSPTAATTWIGSYWDNNNVFYMAKRREEGTINTITVADDVDSALSYSWAGTLAAGEEKEFTATFVVSIAESNTVVFHKLDSTDSAYSGALRFEAVSGGALTTPATKTSSVPGYNYKWSKAESGVGETLEGEETIIYDGTVTEYYENKYQNGIVVPKPSGDFQPEVIVTEKVRDDLKQLVENGYSDVYLAAEVKDISDETDVSLVEQGLKDGELLDDDEEISYLGEISVNTTTTIFDGNNYREDKKPYNGEVELSFVVPDAVRENFNHFRIVKITKDATTGAMSFEELDVEYDLESGLAKFTAKNKDSIVIISSYVELPEVPNTGFVFTSLEGGEGQLTEVIVVASLAVTVLWLGRKAVLAKRG